MLGRGILHMLGWGILDMLCFFASRGLNIFHLCLAAHYGEAAFYHEHLLLEVHLELELAKVDYHAPLHRLQPGHPPHLLFVLPLLHALTHYHGGYDAPLRLGGSRMPTQGGKAGQLLIRICRHVCHHVYQLELVGELRVVGEGFAVEELETSVLSQGALQDGCDG